MRKINTQLFLEDSEAERKRQENLMLLERTERKAAGRRHKRHCNNDLSGKMFGRLRVLKRIPSQIKSGRMAGMWLCACMCGTRIEATTNTLNMGHTKSCGCLQREGRERGFNLKHGCAKTRLRLKVYTAYRSMISRCHYPSATGYDNYGGRGIKVSLRWRKSFQNFLDDMGHPPPGTSLDRKNSDGNYCKRNCRWATRIDQMNNTRRNKFITWDGLRLTISQWGRRLKIKPGVIAARIRLGWDVERIFTTPLKIMIPRY